YAVGSATGALGYADRDSRLEWIGAAPAPRQQHAALEDRLVAQRHVQAPQRVRAGRQGLRQPYLQRRPALVVRRLHDLRRAAEWQVGGEREATRVLLALTGTGEQRRRRRLL